MRRIIRTQLAQTVSLWLRKYGIWQFINFSKIESTQPFDKPQEEILLYIPDANRPMPSLT